MLAILAESCSHGFSVACKLYKWRISCSPTSSR
jgi:hypothetical protein